MSALAGLLRLPEHRLSLEHFPDQRSLASLARYHGRTRSRYAMLAAIVYCWLCEWRRG